MTLLDEPKTENGLQARPHHTNSLGSAAAATASDRRRLPSQIIRLADCNLSTQIVGTSFRLRGRTRDSGRS
jgi:hypothetical protein